jgi:hypothetical protein
MADCCLRAIWQQSPRASRAKVCHPGRAPGSVAASGGAAKVGPQKQIPIVAAFPLAPLGAAQGANLCRRRSRHGLDKHLPRFYIAPTGADGLRSSWLSFAMSIALSLADPPPFGLMA